MINTRDTTGPKRAQEQIRFQRRLLDAVGQAIIATDLQGKIIYWNRAAKELYGWTTEEVMGCPIVEITPSEGLMERAEVEALPYEGPRGDSVPEPQNWRFTAGPRPDGSSKAACPAAWVALRYAAPAAG